MSGRIPQDFINDLLLRVDIVDLIDSHIPLKKTGVNFVARCPFHSEKTPSFSVNRKKQFYYCFGCGASGNAISFLMDYNHLNFVEAVEDLASFVGLPVPRESFKASDQAFKADDLSRLYQLMEQVAEFYVEQLKHGKEAIKAVEYLKNRQVSDAVAQEYKLGYAPEGWNVLASRYDSKLLAEAGLLVAKEGSDGYDRFRGRVMFPIRDKRGRVVGFGARVLDDSVPKYLNSPETPLFSKGNEVYGLYELLQREGRPESILIVEGYMDVVALAQHGIGFAVATLGTATSKAHLELLFRFSPELVFCFDGDKAGQEAAWRAMDASFSCLKDGRRIKIMALPEGHDPDSLIREEGRAEFMQRIDSSQPLSEFFFGHYRSELSLATIEGRAMLVSRAKKYLDLLPVGVFRDMMFQELRGLTGFKKLDVLENKAKLSANALASRRSGSKRLSPSRVAIALLLQNPDLVEIVEQKEIDWSVLNFPGSQLFQEAVDLIVCENPKNLSMLLELFRGRDSEELVKQLAFLDVMVPDEGVRAEFSDALDRLLRHAKDSLIEQLIEKEKKGGLSKEEREQLGKLLVSR
ncbi:MAG: DNA primase [Methylomicrobium sp.]